MTFVAGTILGGFFSCTPSVNRFQGQSDPSPTILSYPKSFLGHLNLEEHPQMLEPNTSGLDPGPCWGHVNPSASLGLTFQSACGETAQRCGVIQGQRGWPSRGLASKLHNLASDPLRGIWVPSSYHWPELAAAVCWLSER